MGQQVRFSATRSETSGEQVLAEGAFGVMAWIRDSVETAEGSGLYDYTDRPWVGSEYPDGTCLAEVVYYRGGDLKMWTTAKDYYWPARYYACDFFAFYPASAAAVTAGQRNGTERPARYISYTAAADNQTDLMVAAGMSKKGYAAYDATQAGGSGGLMRLTFHHALSRVAFAARRTAATAPDPDFSVTVTSVAVGNASRQATFHYHELPNTPGTAATVGWWSDRTAPAETIVYSSTTGVTLTDAGTVYPLNDDGDNPPSMLIPQTLIAWDRTTAVGSTTGNYLKIGCRITVEGYDGNFADEGYIYVPLNGTWEMGNDYTYTLNFGTAFDSQGRPTLQPITVTATVTPWATAVSQAIDPGWI